MMMTRLKLLTITAIDCLHTKHTKFNKYIQKVILIVLQGNTDKHMHICSLQTDTADKYKAKLMTVTFIQYNEN